MKYKVGDRVKVRKDLVVNERYCMDGDIHPNAFVGNMVSAKGCCVTISDVDEDGYRLCEFGYWWTDEMFEGLVFTKQDLQDGDYVTDRNGCEYIVSLKFGKFIDTKRLYMSINSYSADLSLIDADFKEFDIMKVERNGEIIWEREEKSEREILIDKLQAQMDEIKKKIDNLRE